MKKCIVMEIKGSNVAVLNDSGEIKIIRNKNYQKGQVIYMKNLNKIAIMASSIAATLMLTAGIGYGAYKTPYSYVSIDINPSIELELNCFDKVLQVKNINDDALEVLKDVNFKNKSISEAITVATNAIVESGYVSKENGGVMVVASSKNQAKANKLVSQAKVSVEATVDKNLGNDNKVEIDATIITEAELKKAHDMSITPGKLNLIENLAEVMGNEISQEYIDHWKDIAVKDIMKTRNLEKQLKEELEKQMNKLDKLQNNIASADKVTLEKLEKELNKIEAEIENILSKSLSLTDKEKDEIEDKLENVLDLIDDKIENKDDKIENKDDKIENDDEVEDADEADDKDDDKDDTDDKDDDGSAEEAMENAIDKIFSDKTVSGVIEKLTGQNKDLDKIIKNGELKKTIKKLLQNYDEKMIDELLKNSDFIDELNGIIDDDSEIDDDDDKSDSKKDSNKNKKDDKDDSDDKDDYDLEKDDDIEDDKDED